MRDVARAVPSIQPIDVIERWALCHHLGCVVKYLAQAGRKNPLLEQSRLEQARLEQTSLEQTSLEQARLEQARLEHPCPAQAHPDQTRLNGLKKAEWYLARELSRSQCCPFTPMGPQPFTTEAILDDWDLSFHLSEALFHIKASKSPSMRGESLKQAMRHLKAEIAMLEQRIPGPKREEKGGGQ